MQTRRLVPEIFKILHALVAAVAVLFTTHAGHAQPPSTVGVVAGEMRIETPGDKTRFVVMLSRPVEAKTFVIERPDRVVIELPETGFNIDAGKAPGKGGAISALRYGLFAPGRSRVILELAHPVAVTQTQVQAVNGLTYLSVEMQRVDRATFHTMALADAISNVRQPVAPSVQPAPANDKRLLIMIDPGHGGIDSGARAGEVLEKDIVFGFAKTLKARIEQEGKYRVALTRDSDIFIPLDERVSIARAAHADLFLSIHADIISTTQVRGMTVYTGSEQATDAESAWLAEKENQADAVGGIEVAQASEDIADILQELTLRETRSFSNRLAITLVSHLDKVMPLNKNPHRQARFRVLRAPDIPSALIELGYMSSSKDIPLLLSEEWRSKTADTLVKALDQYFVTRPAN